MKCLLLSLFPCRADIWLRPHPLSHPLGSACHTLTLPAVLFILEMRPNWYHCSAPIPRAPGTRGCSAPAFAPSGAGSSKRESHRTASPLPAQTLWPCCRCCSLTDLSPFEAIASRWMCAGSSQSLGSRAGICKCFVIDIALWVDIRGFLLHLTFPVCKMKLPHGTALVAGAARSCPAHGRELLQEGLSMMQLFCQRGGDRTAGPYCKPCLGGNRFCPHCYSRMELFKQRACLVCKEALLSFTTWRCESGQLQG